MPSLLFYKPPLRNWCTILIFLLCICNKSIWCFVCLFTSLAGYRFFLEVRDSRAAIGQFHNQQTCLFFYTVSEHTARLGMHKRQIEHAALEHNKNGFSHTQRIQFAILDKNAYLSSFINKIVKRKYKESERAGENKQILLEINRQITRHFKVTER